ncbi:MAG: phenylalanine--tRNA ligase subunit beta [Alphaproteobacteria bacterium]|nr:MAG: phenylalanine--tRNA ligase subunit beta [Alphaproteobacteria bacterium]
MKFTLSWLKYFLETNATARQIADACTQIGLELESLSDPAEALKAFTIAHVLEARPHPDADRLRVCILDVGPDVNGGKPVQVVCGAPNARTGMKGVFAPPGSHLPGTGMDLKPGIVRGVESNGMLCSERELMLSDDHEGIIELPDDAPLGASYAEYAGLNDPVIDVGVTPNRPDALGVYGIARDLAAKGVGTLKPYAVEPVAGTFASPIKVSLRFDDGDNNPCPLFIGRYFRGVKNGASPHWMQKHLRAVGLRPISALVDITNYVTLSFARPLHVFDADKVTGDIHARLASSGEEIAALDGKTYALDETMTVIADDNGPEAIGGVMGGEPSGCTSRTVNVFLEVAWFDPVRTATTGRKLGIQSDARFRFERGVDPAFVEKGAQIATALILDICGGEASELVIAGKPPLKNASLSLRMDRVRTLTGVDIASAEQTQILERLGFAVTGTGDTVEVAVPTWRPDIHGEADLVEEITRIYGLERIDNVQLPKIETVTSAKISTAQRRRFQAVRALAARGLNEAVTWSFLPRAQAELFGGGKRELQLANPISSELSHMRPSLLPLLIAATGRNCDRGFDDFGLFEAGQVYHGDRPPDERLHVAGIRTGKTAPRHWAGAARPVDIYDAKADALAALDAVGAPVASLQIAAGGPAWYHPGRVGTLQLGPKNQIAVFGEIHPRVLAAMDAEGPLIAFEIDLDAVPQPKAAKTTRAAMTTSDLQAVTRDFAFVVEAGVTAERILRAARGADKALVSNVSVFDIFEGEAIGVGHKSVAIEVTLRPSERTLTDDDIEAVSAKVIGAVEKATGGRLRA